MTATLAGEDASRGIRYLRQPEVLARVGVSWITLSRWEKQGRFPRRRQLGPNTIAWVEAEIEQWCANCANAPEEAR